MDLHFSYGFALEECDQSHKEMLNMLHLTPNTLYVFLSYHQGMHTPYSGSSHVLHLTYSPALWYFCIHGCAYVTCPFLEPHSETCTHPFLLFLLFQSVVVLQFVRDTEFSLPRYHGEII